MISPERCLLLNTFRLIAGNSADSIHFFKFAIGWLCVTDTWIGDPSPFPLPSTSRNWIAIFCDPASLSSFLRCLEGPACCGMCKFWSIWSRVRVACDHPFSSHAIARDGQNSRSCAPRHETHSRKRSSSGASSRPNVGQRASKCYANAGSVIHQILNSLLRRHPMPGEMSSSGHRHSVTWESYVL